MNASLPCGKMGKERCAMGNIRERTWYRQGSELAEEIADTKVPKGTLAFWNLGQCGFVWKEQVTVYIDPVLNDIRDEQGSSRRLYPAPFSPTALYSIIYLVRNFP